MATGPRLFSDIGKNAKVLALGRKGEDGKDQPAMKSKLELHVQGYFEILQANFYIRSQPQKQQLDTSNVE